MLIKNVQGMEMKAEQYARCIIDNLTDRSHDAMPGWAIRIRQRVFWIFVAGISRHVRRCRLERYFMTKSGCFITVDLGLGRIIQQLSAETL